MLELLKQIFGGQNQFAAGGMLLMFVGGVAVYLREIPERLWWWVVAQTTMTVTVKDDDCAFVWVKEWFLEQEFVKRIRRVDLDTTLRYEQLSLIPAPGRHWFWYRGRPFIVWFYRSEDKKGAGWSQRRAESLTFRTIGRDRGFLKGFVGDIAECHKKRTKMVSLLYVYDDGWSFVQAYTPRLLDSIVLKAGEKEDLLQDIENFLASRQRYRRLGVPYHRGYLLYGPPGTGKTSLVSGLAARFGMSIYVVNLTEFNDRTLKTAINEVPQKSVILFEDIDCMKAGNRRSVGEERAPNQAQGTDKFEAADRFGVTLSGLLNVLDGFHAPENVLFVMTTNQVEVLDPALLRPGRIDYKLFLGEAAESQKVELYLRFFPEASKSEAREFARMHFAETMAQFQGLMLSREKEEQSLEVVETVQVERIRA
ncbi:MAG TPA: AAA family ATPase [Terriglobales bacterium]|nr:AAA family ATPase [Terriglobales bacterium]